jgi:hypothetical protein
MAGVIPEEHPYSQDNELFRLEIQPTCCRILQSSAEAPGYDPGMAVLTPLLLTVCARGTCCCTKGIDIKPLAKTYITKSMRA